MKCFLLGLLVKSINQLKRVLIHRLSGSDSERALDMQYESNICVWGAWLCLSRVVLTEVHVTPATCPEWEPSMGITTL